METITFEADGVDHVAVVSEPTPAPTVENAMTRTVDGVEYQIFIAMAPVAGHPDAFIARPIEVAD